MNSLGVLCLFTSVYLLFAAAKRVEYSKGAFSHYWEARPLFARGLALFLTVLGTIFLKYSIGITNALLALPVIWPTIASLVVLFAPLIKKGKHHVIRLRGMALPLVLFETATLPNF